MHRMAPVHAEKALKSLYPEHPPRSESIKKSD